MDLLSSSSSSSSTTTASYKAIKIQLELGMRSHDLNSKQYNQRTKEREKERIEEVSVLTSKKKTPLKKKARSSRETPVDAE